MKNGHVRQENIGKCSYCQELAKQPKAWAAPVIKIYLLLLFHGGFNTFSEFEELCRFSDKN